MSQQDGPKPSAQVVLRPASGVPIDPAMITAANVAQFAPDPATADRVRRALADLGFEIGPFVGNSFAITAPAPTFERVFGRSSPARGLELPLDGLTADVAEPIQAVTFTPPPAFGPTGV